MKDDRCKIGGCGNAGKEFCKSRRLTLKITPKVHFRMGTRYPCIARPKALRETSSIISAEVG
jgi:hypothetical protein